MQKIGRRHEEKSLKETPISNKLKTFYPLNRREMHMTIGSTEITTITIIAGYLKCARKMLRVHKVLLKGILLFTTLYQQKTKS